MRTVAPEVRAGARLFADSGCLQCHVYGDLGSSNLGAPDLTRVGTRARGPQWYVRYLRCPRCVRRDSLKPVYAALGDANLRKLAAFLRASDGNLVDLLEAEAAGQ